ncbi:armadillo-type protein [Haematococcus lacustris]
MPPPPSFSCPVIGRWATLLRDSRGGMVLQLAVLEQQCVTPLLAAMALPPSDLPPLPILPILPPSDLPPLTSPPPAPLQARNSESLPVLRQAAWLLSNLTRPRPQSKELHDAIPTLTAILTTPDMDTEVLTHSCWALAYLSSEEEAVRELADPEVALPLMRHLAQWVAQPQQPTTAPALRIIGHMCSGSTALTQVVVDGGAIPALLACLTDSNRLSLKKEAIWTLSNIAAGTCPQVAALLASGAYPRVMACLRGAEASLKRECCYVLANPWADTVGLSQTVAEQLVEAGVVQPPPLAAAPPADLTCRPVPPPPCCPPLQELVSLLQPGQPLPLLLVAMEGLQDAIKRGQKLMMAVAKERAARARQAELAREEAEGAQAADAGPPPGPAGADGVSGSGAPPPPPAGTPEESEPAVLRNSVAQAMKGCGVMLRLEELLHHQDSAVHAKSNALRNILEFM